MNFVGIAIAGKTLSKTGPHSLDTFKQVLDVNVAGTFNVIRLAADSMKNQEPFSEFGERGFLTSWCVVVHIHLCSRIYTTHMYMLPVKNNYTSMYIFMLYPLNLVA